MPLLKSLPLPLLLVLAACDSAPAADFANSSNVVVEQVKPDATPAACISMVEAASNVAGRSIFLDDQAKLAWKADERSILRYARSIAPRTMTSEGALTAYLPNNDKITFRYGHTSLFNVQETRFNPGKSDKFVPSFLSSLSRIAVPPATIVNSEGRCSAVWDDGNNFIVASWPDDQKYILIDYSPTDVTS